MEKEKVLDYQLNLEKGVLEKANKATLLQGLCIKAAISVLFQEIEDQEEIPFKLPKNNNQGKKDIEVFDFQIEVYNSRLKKIQKVIKKQNIDLKTLITYFIEETARLEKIAFELPVADISDEEAAYYNKSIAKAFGVTS